MDSFALDKRRKTWQTEKKKSNVQKNKAHDVPDWHRLQVQMHALYVDYVDAIIQERSTKEIESIDNKINELREEMREKSITLLSKRRLEELFRQAAEERMGNARRQMQEIITSHLMEQMSNIPDWVDPEEFQLWLIWTPRMFDLLYSS